MQLLGELCRREIPSVHITNSKSFTTIMRSLIQRKRDRMWGSRAVEGLFRLSHNWVRRKDAFEVAICDEAHRFRRSTDMYPFLISKRPQAEEIMEHVRIMVAFVDEKQRLRIAEEGTLNYFTDCALDVGIKPHHIHGPIELKTQFRYAGNDQFTKSLDKALYEDRSEGFKHQHFQFGVFDSIMDLENELKQKINRGFSARLVAGFCWPWSDPDRNGNLIPDVRIGSWSRPWNRRSRGVERANEHPYTIWARGLSDPLEQVGCIYSIQGFEFDYIGVI